MTFFMVPIASLLLALFPAKEYSFKPIDSRKDLTTARRPMPTAWYHGIIGITTHIHCTSYNVRRTCLPSRMTSPNSDGCGYMNLFKKYFKCE